MNYNLCIHVFTVCTANEASYFQLLIGIIIWMVEIGRIDIATEISFLSSHSVISQVGHIQAAIHVISYLKDNSCLVFDPTYPTWDVCDFYHYDWTTCYGDVKEAVPSNAPEPLGSSVILRSMVDSDNSSDKTTRQSPTGYFIWLNQALIRWLSKRHPTIESAVFGAEFFALKNVMESLRGTCYKLCMMGLPIN